MQRHGPGGTMAHGRVRWTEPCVEFCPACLVSPSQEAGHRQALWSSVCKVHWPRSAHDEVLLVHACGSHHLAAPACDDLLCFLPDVVETPGKIVRKQYILTSFDHGFNSTVAEDSRPNLSYICCLATSFDMRYSNYILKILGLLWSLFTYGYLVNKLHKRPRIFSRGGGGDGHCRLLLTSTIPSLVMHQKV